MAYQEGERAKQMENPTMRGPLESNAKRFAALAEKLGGGPKTAGEPTLAATLRCKSREERAGLRPPARKPRHPRGKPGNRDKLPETERRGRYARTTHPVCRANAVTA